MSTVLELPLVDGPLPLVLTGLAAVALLGLLALPRGGRRRAAAAVAGLLVTALLVAVANPLVIDGMGLFPQDLPREVVGWSAVGIGALALAVAGAVRAGIGRTVLALGCGLLVVLGAASQVNAYYARFTTLADLVGPGPDVVALPVAPAASVPAAGVPAPSVATTAPHAKPTPEDPARSGSESTPVVSRAKPGGGKAKGTLAAAHIPGAASGFPARDGYVYLPPAYSPTGPRLPVMVLVAGQPGGPGDWLSAGRLVAQLDRFAAAHQGLAPVTVVVDPTGSDFANTACLDSKLGKAETYLAKDVPDWVRGQLRVDTNPSHWTFGGFSFGGTCALQLATRFPHVYGSFIDLQGEQEPSLGPDRRQTVQTLFGGDSAAFEAVLPMRQLATRTFHGSWGFFASGSKDTLFLGYMSAVSNAATRAGMTVTTVTVPGQGHSWAIPQSQLIPALEWLSPHLGFTT